jgi:hypothetical protein
MTPGYITLDRLHEITRDVTGWQAAHPHLSKPDMSEPSTAEVMTVPIVRPHGTSSTDQTLVRAGRRPPGYRGLRRRYRTQESRIWWAMIGAGIAFMAMSLLSVVAIQVFVF